MILHLPLLLDPIRTTPFSYQPLVTTPSSTRRVSTCQPTVCSYPSSSQLLLGYIQRYFVFSLLQPANKIANSTADELYITSGLLQSASTSYSPTILISRLKLHRNPNTSTPNHIHQTNWSKMRPPPGIDSKL